MRKLMWFLIFFNTLGLFILGAGIVSDRNAAVIEAEQAPMPVPTSETEPAVEPTDPLFGFFYNAFMLVNKPNVSVVEGDNGLTQVTYVGAGYSVSLTTDGDGKSYLQVDDDSGWIVASSLVTIDEKTGDPVEFPTISRYTDNLDKVIEVWWLIYHDLIKKVDDPQTK